MIEPLVDTGVDLKALQNLFKFQMAALGDRLQDFENPTPLSKLRHG